MKGSANKQGFRPDIQGLRAVAAVLVCIYHIWFGRVSGGVDVFFVVSGFLITGMLLRQLDRQGQVNFFGFWAQLLKRLLPAAITVILFTALGSFLLLPKVEWKDTIKEAAAAAVYLENWRLAFNAVDYLARDTALSPFQHFWALSTQGQIYLVWPGLVALTFLVARRRQWDVRRAMAGALGAVFLISLIHSILSTASNQAFAYFDTGARLWEFALGGLLGVASGRWQPGPRGRVLLGWGGLLAIASCGLLIQVSTVFPGYMALWPTLGAICILLAGPDGGRWGVSRLLQAKPLQFLGSISYAFYLWHWPLLVLATTYLGTRQVSVVQGGLIMFCAGLLAWMTTFFLERPIRWGSFPGPRPLPAFVFGAGCIATIGCVLMLWTTYTLRLQAGEAEPAAWVGGPDYPGAQVLMMPGRLDAMKPLPPLPGPFRIKSDLPASYGDRVHQRLLDDKVLIGEYGRKEGRYVIALVGGSHSTQWLPAFQVIAERLDLRILTMTKSSCWFSDEPWMEQTLEGAAESCRRWNRNLMKELKRIRPDAVVTTLTRAAGIELVPPKFVDKWRQMEEMGIDVIAIRDTPWHSFDPSMCVDVFGRNSRRCQLSRQKALQPVNPAADLAGLPATLRQVDLTRFLCDDQHCPPVIGNVMVYRDTNHLSASYSRTLAPALEPFIQNWLASRSPASDPAATAQLHARLESPRDGGRF